MKEIRTMIEDEKKKTLRDSVIPKTVQIPIVTNDRKENQAARKKAKEKQKVEITKVRPKVLVDDRRNEKTFYYSKSKLVSLHVSAWKDDQQEFKLYDLKGKLT